LVIATINSALAPIAWQAVRHGKHVLVEKPAAVNLGGARRRRGCRQGQ
jgi:predicted dehydrogenase